MTEQASVEAREAVEAVKVLLFDELGPVVRLECDDEQYDHVACKIVEMVTPLASRTAPAAADVEVVAMALQDKLIELGHYDTAVAVIQDLSIARAAIAAMPAYAPAKDMGGFIEWLKDDPPAAMPTTDRKGVLEEAARVADEEASRMENGRRLCSDAENRACYLWARQTAQSIAAAIRNLANGEKSGG